MQRREQAGVAAAARSPPVVGETDKLASVRRCLASLPPCAALSFLQMMYASFGSYVTMSILTYCLNEGFAFPVAGIALKVFYHEKMHLDGATSARHTVVARVGWIAKPFVGMLSDAWPLGGYRRSSYIALACTLGIVGWATLGFMDLSAQATLPFLVMASLSLAVPDVMIDAYTAEIVKTAPEHASHTQSLNFGAFAIGGLLASSVSGVFITRLGPRACFLVLAACLLSLLLATLTRCLPERRLPREARGLSVAWLREHAQLAGLSTAMSLAAVALIALQILVQESHLRLKIACAFAVVVPMGFYLALRRVSVVLARIALFIFLHGCLHPSYPDTMFQWMRMAPNGPHFSKVVLGWTHVFGSLGLLLGVWIYGRFLTRRTYRCIFSLAIVATALPSAFDVVLLTRVNLALGIPDLAVAIGDDAVSNCIVRLFRMPVAVLAMKVCPCGMEGSIMSIILSLGGFGHSLGVLYGSCMLEAFGVVRRDFSHFTDAVVAGGVIQLLPLLFIPLLVPPGLRPCDDILVSDNGRSGEAANAPPSPDRDKMAGTKPSTEPPGSGAVDADASPSMERNSSLASTAVPGNSPAFRSRMGSLSEMESDLEWGGSSFQSAHDAVHHNSLGELYPQQELEPSEAASSDARVARI